MPSKGQPKPGLTRLAPVHQSAPGTKHDSTKRIRTNDRATKLAQAKEAEKKKNKKVEIQSRKPNVYEFNFIYVGNLRPKITTSILESFFEQYGQIKRTIIRCSRGQAVVTGLAVPDEVLGPRDHQYASIEFMDPQSARKALEGHGVVLDGCELVVSFSPADLPEVEDIVQKRVACMRKKQIGLMPPPRSPPQRVIIASGTEKFTGFRDPSEDRHNIFGFSFAKGIM